jgi:hypothetical protein
VAASSSDESIIELGPQPKKRRINMHSFDNANVKQNSEPQLSSSFKALYLFAGLKRKASIGDLLLRHGWTVDELDILRSRKQDLSRKHLRERILGKVASGEYQLVISSPPCDTFTRVKYANSFGPAPTRSKQYLRGFPWLSPAKRRTTNLGNLFADFSYEVIQTQLRSGASLNLAIMEHPEDLGVVLSGKHKGKSPGSIWQFPQHQSCIEDGARSVGLLQSDFDMPYPKPTRLLLKIPGKLPKQFYQGLPEFSTEGKYLGPIPRSITHSATLAKQSNSEDFRTTGTAAWPPRLCSLLVDLVVGATQGAEKDSHTTRSESGPPFPPQSEAYPIHHPPPGSTKGGRGPPRRVLCLNKWHDFHDGAGLCSPGRWDKQHRVFPEGRRWEILREEIQSIVFEGLSEADILKQVLGLCCGKEALFQAHRVPRITQAIHKWLQKQTGDYSDSDEAIKTEGQPFFLGLIKFVLRESQDPDFGILDDYMNGVNLGVSEPLPHTPAVFELQEKWRLKENPLEVAEWINPNYASLSEHSEAIKLQLQEEEAEGMVGSTSFKKFKSWYPEGFAISALSVLQEKEKLRLLHDGTHVTRVNHRIRSRDKLRCPGPREKALLLNGFKERGRIGMSLLADVGKAHRRVKVRQSDWAWQACTLESKELQDDSVIWFNKVGTFGIGSAAYWWGRLGGAIVRCLYYLLGPTRALDALLYADDLELIIESTEERPNLLLAVSILFALGVPLKWSKFRGGFDLEWVGFAFSHKSYSIGISETRANWLCKWIADVLKSGLVDIDEFGAVLGRLNFAALALIYERPFLGILYFWNAAIVTTAGKTMRLPWAIRMVLHWFERRLKEERGRQVASSAISSIPTHGNRMELFRSDAKATEKGAWIGGWEYAGGQPSQNARWFAMKVDPKHFPWIFSKKDPKRVIAALELLATVICVIVFGKPGCFNGTLSGSTDNQGNVYAVSRLMSTKFPLTILLMELSEQLRTRNAAMDLVWLPREENQEADNLTNEKYGDFDEAKRIHIQEDKLGFLVLGELQVTAQELYQGILSEKERKTITPFSKGKNKWVRKKLSIKQRLKWKAPW